MLRKNQVLNLLYYSDPAKNYEAQWLTFKSFICVK